MSNEPLQVEHRCDVPGCDWTIPVQLRPPPSGLDPDEHAAWLSTLSQAAAHNARAWADHQREHFPDAAPDGMPVIGPVLHDADGHPAYQLAATTVVCLIIDADGRTQLLHHPNLEPALVAEAITGVGESLTERARGL